MLRVQTRRMKRQRTLQPTQTNNKTKSNESQYDYKTSADVSPTSQVLRYE